MKFDPLFEKIVDNAITAKKSVMLVGPPGIGKSCWAASFAANRKSAIFIFNCNQVADKSDLDGQRLLKIGVDKNGLDIYAPYFYPHEVIQRAIDYAEKHTAESVYLFLDEVNRTTSDVTSALLSLITARQIGSKTLPPNIKVIAAGNDKGNVSSFDSASTTRFVIFNCMPDLKTYLEVNPDLHPIVRATLTQHPKLLMAPIIQNIEGSESGNDTVETDIFDEDDNAGLNMLTNPRTISGLSDQLNLYSKEDLLECLNAQTLDKRGHETNYLQELVFGSTGETQFSVELLAALSAYASTPDVEDAASEGNRFVLACPDEYASLNAATEHDQLDRLVQSLSPEVIGHNLVYALQDKDARLDVVSALTKGMTGPLALDDNMAFGTLVSQSLICSVNAEKALEVEDCPFIQFYASYLQKSVQSR